MRQRLCCYTIRAGRNLPDKEFRYLRTVIVTAAVYWGFSSERRPPCGGLTPPLNLPAPGRCQSLYVVLTTSQRHVFLLNSHRALFTASLVRSGCAPSRPRPPLIPKLRGEIAEFLNEGSIERLSLFSSPTCVGLRYGLPINWGGGVFLAASPLSVHRNLRLGSPSPLTLAGYGLGPGRPAPGTT